MYNGIKAMIEAEKKLAAAAGGANKAPAATPAGNVKAGPHLKKPEDITGFVEWPAGTTSLTLGTSSGIHARHNDYYIRRLRVGKNEAIYDYLQLVHPELVEEFLQ